MVQKDLAGFGFAKVAPSEVFRKISQNFSPAGVTSPFVARAIPTDSTSVVPVSGRKSRRLPATSLKIVVTNAMPRPASTSVISELALSHSTAMGGLARMEAKRRSVCLGSK